MRAIVTVLRSFLISLVMVNEELVCFPGGGSGNVCSSLLLIPGSPRLSQNYKVAVVLFPVLVKGELTGG